MLDVLDLDALRAPDEDGVGVRRVHDVGDLEPELAGLGDVLVRRGDLDRQVVQERPLRISGLALRGTRRTRRRPRHAARRRGPEQRARSRGARTRRRSPWASATRARRDPGRTRPRSAPRRGPGAEPSATSKYTSPARGRSTFVPSSSASASSRFETRSATCLSAPCSRGPSAPKSVSLPRRASEPTSVNASVRSTTCIPSRSVTKPAIRSRSATQRATWSSVFRPHAGRIASALLPAGRPRAGAAALFIVERPRMPIRLASL